MASTRSVTLDPAPPVDAGGGGRGRWSWLLTASGIVEAELVRGVLDQAGVPVVLDRRDPSPFAWMYLAGNVNAPVQIFVPSGLLETARLHLLDAGVEGDRALGAADAAPAAEPPRPSGIYRVLRQVLTVAVLLVAAWIVLMTMIGQGTCALRLFC